MKRRDQKSCHSCSEHNITPPTQKEKICKFGHLIKLMSQRSASWSTNRLNLANHDSVGRKKMSTTWSWKTTGQIGIPSSYDFLQSIENLKTNTISLNDGESKEEYHLKEKTGEYLASISSLIYEMHKSKNLERFLAKVFRRIPGVIDVSENGFGWGTDYGADLIVLVSSSLGNLEFENKIIVQVKSFEGTHHDLEAVDQVITGIKKYEGTAGMIITTAKKSEQLESGCLRHQMNSAFP